MLLLYIIDESCFSFKRNSCRFNRSNLEPSLTSQEERSDVWPHDLPIYILRPLFVHSVTYFSLLFCCVSSFRNCHNTMSLYKKNYRRFLRWCSRYFLLDSFFWLPRQFDWTWRGVTFIFFFPLFPFFSRSDRWQNTKDFTKQITIIWFPLFYFIWRVVFIIFKGQDSTNLSHKYTHTHTHIMRWNQMKMMM